jgi:hypothetical protein
LEDVLGDAKVSESRVGIKWSQRRGGRDKKRPLLKHGNCEFASPKLFKFGTLCL